MKLDTILCIDQNIIQACQPGFFKIWRMWIFLLKKPWDFSLNRTFENCKKIIGLQAISLLFELVSSSKEVFLGGSDLFDA